MDDRSQLDGRIVALYLFDVAETVELSRIAGLIQEPVAQSRLVLKPVTPAYVQYDKPPITFDAGADVEGWSVRFRIYDYGIISVAMSRPFAGTWRDLVSAGQEFIENSALEQLAERQCRTTADRLRPALIGLRKSFLSEDYIVFVVNRAEPPCDAASVLATHAEDIALMLRGEGAGLSAQERDRILQHRMSYLANDLVVPSWNAAFVLDTAAGAEATIEVFEFANSQLLEFRYYDRLLDDELESVYSRLKRPHWFEQWVGAHYTRAARHVHSLFIDVNELTDRSENALKFVGDLWAARLYASVTDRLGLERWKAIVQEKLKTLDDVYRFAVEQSSMARGHIMELTVVLILVVELVMAVLQWTH